jgi:hypothetical protein
MSVDSYTSNWYDKTMFWRMSYIFWFSYTKLFSDISNLFDQLQIIIAKLANYKFQNCKNQTFFACNAENWIKAIPLNFNFSFIDLKTRLFAFWSNCSGTDGYTLFEIMYFFNGALLISIIMSEAHIFYN